MSNAKAHSFNAQMDAQARIRALEEQVRERDETIVRLQAELAELQARSNAPTERLGAPDVA
jgi:uncharacterized coiled-coil protein SlyX